MKRKFVRVVIALLCLALPFIVWRLWLAYDVSRQLAEIHAAGLPTNGRELNTWYAAVPDNQNAALVLTQAFALLRDFSDKRSDMVWKLKLPRSGTPLSAEQTGLIREYVEMNSEMLAKADEASKLPASRYPVDFSLLTETPLPHLAWVKRTAMLNQFKAELAIQAGRNEDASACIEKMLGLVRTLDNEPCLISQLVRFACLKMAVMSLERRINAGKLGSDEIVRLSSAFSKTSATNQVARAFVGERAMFAAFFRMSRDDITRFATLRKTNEAAEGNSPLPHKGPAILRWGGYYELDFRYFLSSMENVIPLASLPPPENLEAGRHLARTGAKAGFRTISRALLPNWVKAVARENDVLAFQRMATIALAIEQYRNLHGQFPENLDELMPKFLAEIPEDPFVGWGFEYRRREKGYCMYSVGLDQNDDGGLDESDKKQSSSGKSYDLPFLVER